MAILTSQEGSDGRVTESARWAAARARRRALTVAWPALAAGLLVLVVPPAVEGLLGRLLVAGLAAAAVGINLGLARAGSWLDRMDGRFLVVTQFVLAGLVGACELMAAEPHPLYLAFYALPVACAGFRGGVRAGLLLALWAGVLATVVEAHLAGAASPTGVRITVLLLVAAYVGWPEENLREQLQDTADELAEAAARIDRLVEDNRRMERQRNEIQKELEDLSREVQSQRALVGISQTLAEDLELLPLLERVVRKVREFVPYHSISIYLYDSDKVSLYTAAADGFFLEEMSYQLDPEMGIPAAVARTRKPLVLQDVKGDPRFRKILATARVESAVYMPIGLDEASYGCLSLWSMEAAAYDESSVERLRYIARVAARAIRNAEVFQQVERRLGFIISLWEISKTLSTAVDASDGWSRLMKEALGTVRQLFSADKLTYFHYDPARGVLEPSLTEGLSEGVVAELRGRLRSDPRGMTFLLRSTLQVHDIQKDRRLIPMAGALEVEQVRSMLLCPLSGRQSESALGALALFSCQERRWTSEEVRWLEIFANMFSTALENVQLMNDLVAEKTQLQVLVDNVPEGVYTTDRDRRIITWNAAATRITGWRLDEVVGEPCSRFIACQAADEGVWCESRCPLVEAMNQEGRVDSGMGNVVLVTREGGRVPVFLTSAPIYGEEGKVAGSILVFRDMTREREIEEMKETFLATITHDLKSPLASIMGYGELLLNPKVGGLNESQQEFVQAILRSSKTLQILINNILQSTRLESEGIALNYAAFELGGLFAELEEMFRPLVAHKKQILEIEAEGGMHVYADREKIKEVLLNLISNAVKFTPREGRITLRARTDGEKVLVEVCDTGKGIPKDQQGRLFQKFSQVKGEKGGTGLGLYIVRKVLEAHGEEIELESEVGEGATFRFRLARFAPDPISGNGSPRVMLIHGRDPHLTGFLKGCLEQGGYFVDEIDSAQVAPEVAERRRPPLILMDSTALDGDLVHRLRSSAGTRDVPLLLVCERTEEVPPGFAASVVKPVDHQDLLAKVRDLVHSRNRGLPS